MVNSIYGVRTRRLRSGNKNRWSLDILVMGEGEMVWKSATRNGEYILVPRKSDAWEVAIELLRADIRSR